MFSGAPFVTVAVWVVKPTKLNTRVLPSGAVREKRPSALVEVPVTVPRTSTVTPGRPVPSAPVTRPLTGTSAAGRTTGRPASATGEAAAHTGSPQASSTVVRRSSAIR